MLEELAELEDGRFRVRKRIRAMKDERDKRYAVISSMSLHLPSEASTDISSHAESDEEKHKK